MIQNYKIKGKIEGSIPWEQPPASASASVERSPYREQPEKSTASRLGHFLLQPQSSPSPEPSSLPARRRTAPESVEDTLSKDGPPPQEWGGLHTPLSPTSRDALGLSSSGSIQVNKLAFEKHLRIENRRPGE